MNGVIIADIVIVVILLFGLIQGLRNGIVKELAFFIAIILGIIISKLLSPVFAVYIQDFTGWQVNISLLIAYVGLFLAVAISLHFVAFLITKTLKQIALGWLNRLLGSVFGLLKWGLIVSVILNLVTFLNLEEKLFSNSILFAPIESILHRVLPFTDMLKEINFNDIEEQFSKLV